MNIPDKLIIHHTGGTDQNPRADTSHHTFEMVDQYHKSLGWGKIGYHYFISKEGKITQGRGDREEGAHTIGENRRSLGICLAGNFDVFEPVSVQIESLRKLLKAKTEEYNIPASRVYPHRLFANKTCYGKKLSNTWAAELLESDNIIKLKLQLKILELKLAIAKLVGLA